MNIQQSFGVWENNKIIKKKEKNDKKKKKDSEFRKDKFYGNGGILPWQIKLIDEEEKNKENKELEDYLQNFNAKPLLILSETCA